MVVSRFLIRRRTIFARRCSLRPGVSSWVSLILTNASSAATKKPFTSTSAITPSTLNRLASNTSILQPHLAENDLENVLQTHNPRLALVPSQYNAQPLAAPPHALQGLFQRHVFLHVQRRFHVIARRPRQVQVRLVKHGLQAQDAHDAPVGAFPAPDRQPRHFFFPGK